MLPMLMLLLILGLENVSLSNANIGENPMPRKPKGSSARFVHRGGNTLQVTLWNEIATAFDAETYDLVEKPVILAVSSCRPKLFRGDLQLNGTKATHCYFNPPPLVCHLYTCAAVNSCC
ncbi:uncharacterized protein [Rutidosis leptorrhynchoides]|uniref:uncharacterized protein isoform X1 n=1 Tax=Rutidosis leptorrhynchoides TaxID=125765 RepID=UPI003A9939B8